MFVFSNAIEYLLQQQKTICYVDFTKAFDLLVRGNIFYKLIEYGIRGKIMNKIYSLFPNVKSSVKFENEIIITFVTSLGTKQGDSLFPFIFSMYVNDLEVEMTKPD